MPGTRIRLRWGFRRWGRGGTSGNGYWLQRYMHFVDVEWQGKLQDNQTESIDCRWRRRIVLPKYVPKHFKCIRIDVEQRFAGSGTGSCPGVEQSEHGYRGDRERSGETVQSPDQPLAGRQTCDLGHASAFGTGDEIVSGESLWDAGEPSE